MRLFAVKRYLARYPKLFHFAKRLAAKGRAFAYAPLRKRKSKNKLDEINTAHQKCESVLWYFGIAVHKNLGDLAQTCCTLGWMQTNYPNSHVVEISNRLFDAAPSCFMEALKTSVCESDLIFFQSGYTMTGTHEYEPMREAIVKAFPQCRIVLLPQTIRYADDACALHASSVYKNQKNLLILTRDKSSFAAAQRLFPGTQLALYPDVVTTLIGKYAYSFQREGVLFCVRDDWERFYPAKEIKRLQAKTAEITTCSQTDTHANIRDPEDHAEVWNYMEKTFARYARYRLVVTDRFHGMVFALIAGTPVIVLKTTDHKVTVGAQWLQAAYPAYVHVARDLDEAEALIGHMLKLPLPDAIKPCFASRYYDHLRDLIDRRHF